MTVPDLSMDGKVELEQGRGTVDAAFKAGVKYMVFTSATAADDSRARAVPTWNSKYLVEEHIRSKSWPDGFAIIRPDGFFENIEMFGPATRGRIDIWYVNANTKLPQISARDIGVFGALAFLKPEDFRGKVLEIASETLTVTEMCKILTELTGTRWAWSPLLPKWMAKFILPSLYGMISFVEAGVAK
ncbi:hypothetical protein HDU93_005962, partial [Gonapodya sp. JEL0774]